MRQLLLCAALTLCATSCYETVILDPKADLPVIVRCVLTDTTTTQTLFLHYAISPSEITPVPIETADEVSVSDGVSVHQFRHIADGRWESEHFPTDYNRTYSLKISIGDLTLTAETTFPDRIGLKTEFIYFDSEVAEKDGSGCYAVRLQDADGAPYQEACKLWAVSRSPRNRSESVAYKDGHSYTSEFLVTTNEYADKFNICSLTCMDLPCFFVESRKKASDYQEAKVIEYYGKNRADELFSTSYSVSLVPYFLRRYYPEKSVHRKAVRIPLPKNYSNRDGIGKIEDDSESKLCGDEYAFLVAGDYNMDDPDSWKIPVVKKEGIIDRYAHLCDFICIDYLVMSDEYDTFMKELYTRGINADDGVAMDILYNQKNLPSNVSNGYGIFGAQSVLQCLPYKGL